jgi:hypothetical protein
MDDTENNLGFERDYGKGKVWILDIENRGIMLPRNFGIYLPIWTVSYSSAHTSLNSNMCK